MTGWLITNGFLRTKKFQELTDLFMESASRQGIQLKEIQNTQILPGTLVSSKPDFVIFWDKDILLARYLEDLAIPVFNSSQFIRVCDDKRKTFLALSREGFPVPKTILAPMTYDKTSFSDLSFIESVMEHLSFPFILKEGYGSFGQQVYMIRSQKELMKHLNNTTTTELLFQEYIQSSYGRDLRLQVVGDEVVSCMKRISDNDFRANISAGGRMEPYAPTAKQCELAIRAVKALGGDFGGVDLLFDKDEDPVICEINSNAHFKNLLDCTHINTADKILEYIQKKITR